MKRLFVKMMFFVAMLPAAVAFATAETTAPTVELRAPDAPKAKAAPFIPDKLNLRLTFIDAQTNEPVLPKELRLVASQGKVTAEQIAAGDTTKSLCAPYKYFSTLSVPHNDGGGDKFVCGALDVPLPAGGMTTNTLTVSLDSSLLPPYKSAFWLLARADGYIPSFRPLSLATPSEDNAGPMPGAEMTYTRVVRLLRPQNKDRFPASKYVHIESSEYNLMIPPRNKDCYFGFLPPDLAPSPLETLAGERYYHLVFSITPADVKFSDRDVKLKVRADKLFPQMKRPTALLCGRLDMNTWRLTDKRTIKAIMEKPVKPKVDETWFYELTFREPGIYYLWR